MQASRSTLQAAGFAIAAFSLWVLQDTTIKFAGHYRLPAYEFVAFLGFFIAAFLTFSAIWRKQVRNLWPKRPKTQFVRSCLDLGNNVFVVVALRHVPLTLFYLMVFTAPLVVAILAAIFLHEKLDWRKIAAILVGFGGVVIAVDPLASSKRGDLIGYAACAICVLCFSTGMVWSRKMAQTETPESMTFSSGLVMAIAGSGCMLWHAAPLSLRLLAVLFAMGWFCALGNICFFVALKHTAAIHVAPYHYTQLISGALLAYLIFDEKPTIFMLMGGTLIIASGLYTALQARR